MRSKQNLRHSVVLAAATAGAVLVMALSARAATVDVFTDVDALLWSTGNTAPSKTVHFVGAETGVEFDLTLATNMGNLMIGNYKPVGVSYLADSAGINGGDWFEGILTVTASNFTGAAPGNITFRLVNVSGRELETSAFVLTSTATQTVEIPLGVSMGDKVFSNVALDSSAASMAGGSYVGTLAWKYFNSESSGLYKTFSFEVGLQILAAYWDLNGTDPNACVGGGHTAAGVWNATDPNWNTDATGGPGGTVGAWVPGQRAFFAAGSDANGIYTVNVDGTHDISGLGFEEGTVTLDTSTGGKLRLVNNADVEVAATLTATIQTAITEDATPRSLTKKGAGTLVLSPGVVGYTGGTTVGAGTLRLGGNDVFDGNSVKVAGNGAGVTATLDLDGHDDTVSSLTLGGAGATCGASVITGGGTLTLGGNVTYDSTNAPLGATISGKLNLGSATRTVTVGDSASAADDLTISADISGDTGVGLTKAGAGTLYLSGANTYSSPTTLGAGTLRTSAPSVLPGYDSPGNVVFNGGTLLVVLGGGWTMDDVATVAGNATKTSGTIALDTSGGSATQTAALDLGGLGLTKVGSNALTLDRANTYTGATTVTAGTLRLASAGAISSSSGLALANGSTLELRSDTGATFTTPAATLPSGATATIDVNNNGSGTGNILALGGGLSTTASWTLNVTGGNGYSLSIPTATFSHATAPGNRTLNPTTANVSLGTVSLLLNGTSGDPKLVLGGTSNDNRIDSMTVSVASGGNRYNIEKNTAATWTINNFNGGGGVGNQFLLSAGDLIVTGSLNVAGMGNGLVMNGGTLHYNSPGAIHSDAGTRFRFNNASVKLDNTSGAAITTSTYNPQMAWYANWTFVGSKGANSDLYLGTGAVTMNATRQVTVQHADTTLTVGGVISGTNFGLTKAGDGTLALSGANLYTGPTTVNQGTLLINNPGSLNASSAVTVNNTGSLGGSGTINGTVTVKADGSLAPGAGAGTLTVNNSLTMEADSTYVWQFGSDDLSHVVDVNGALSITSDWTLKLVDLGGTPGSEYDLFTFDSFPQVTLTAPTINYDGAPDWSGASVALDGNRVVLKFGLPGDTNGDFVVDAADFITLKKNFGAGEGGGAAVGNFDKAGTVDWADLSTLMTNMGAGSKAPATTPEPATLGLLAIGALAMLRRRRAA